MRRAGQFDGEPGSIAAARDLAASFMEQLVSEWLVHVPERAVQNVLLVVSELVTNAERYAPGPCLLDLEWRGDGAVEITVWDTSPDLPTVLPPDPGRIGGHGMEIVSRLSSGMDIKRVPMGKQVRVRVELV